MWYNTKIDRLYITIYLNAQMKHQIRNLSSVIKVIECYDL